MRKKYRVISIEEVFAQMAEDQAYKHKRSLSDQIEVDIEEAEGK